MNPAIRVGATLGLSSVVSAFLISVTSYAVAALLVQALLRPDPLAIARHLNPARAAQPARIQRRQRRSYLRIPLSIWQRRDVARDEQ